MNSIENECFFTKAQLESNIERHGNIWPVQFNSLIFLSLFNDKGYWFVRQIQNKQHRNKDHIKKLLFSIKQGTPPSPFLATIILQQSKHHDNLPASSYKAKLGQRRISSFSPFLIFSDDEVIIFPPKWESKIFLFGGWQRMTFYKSGLNHKIILRRKQGLEKLTFPVLVIAIMKVTKYPISIR